MNVLVTGAKGALGSNLVENLKTIRDGKNKTRPNLTINSIFEYDIENTAEELDQFCADCDFVVHAAGVNRPKETSEFMEGNFGFTSTLLDTLKKHKNKSPIMITSSVQATLSGRFGDSEYGRSKLAGEELMFKYGEDTGAPVYIYRFENMVGKWIRPRYNSGVATFCTLCGSVDLSVKSSILELFRRFLAYNLLSLYTYLKTLLHLLNNHLNYFHLYIF